MKRSDGKQNTGVRRCLARKVITARKSCGHPYVVEEMARVQVARQPCVRDYWGQDVMAVHSKGTRTH